MADCQNCAIDRRGGSFPCACFQCGKVIQGNGPEAIARELLDREYGKDHPAARHNFTVTFRTTTHEHQVRELTKALQEEGDRRAVEMRERAIVVCLGYATKWQHEADHARDVLVDFERRTEFEGMSSAADCLATELRSLPLSPPEAEESRKK